MIEEIEMENENNLPYLLFKLIQIERHGFSDWFQVDSVFLTSSDQDN